MYVDLTDAWIFHSRVKPFIKFQMSVNFLVKFIFSEKATSCCEISIVDLSYLVPVKSTVEISQNFVAFLEYMNFNGT